MSNSERVSKRAVWRQAQSIELLRRASITDLLLSVTLLSVLALLGDLVFLDGRYLVCDLAAPSIERTDSGDLCDQPLKSSQSVNASHDDHVSDLPAPRSSQFSLEQNSVPEEELRLVVDSILGEIGRLELEVEEKTQHEISESLSELLRLNGNTARLFSNHLGGARFDHGLDALLELTSKNSLDAIDRLLSIKQVASIFDSEKLIAVYQHFVQLDPENAGLLNSLAYLDIWRGNRSAAQSNVLKALKINDGQNLLKVESLHLAAGIHFESRYEVELSQTKAAEHCEEAFRIAMSIQATEYLDYCQLMLFSIYASRDELEKSRAISEQALSVYRSVNDKSQIASQLNFMGLMDLGLTDFDGAIDKLQKAIVLYKELGDELEVAIAYNQVCFSQYSLSRLDAAIRSCEEAMRFGQRTESKELMATSLTLIGMASYLSEDFSTARSSWESGLELLKGVSSPLVQALQDDLLNLDLDYRRNPPVSSMMLLNSEFGGEESSIDAKGYD